MKKPFTGSFCGASYCTNNSGVNKDLSFFKFPSDEKRSIEWMIRLCRNDLIEKGYKYAEKNCKVCSIHFTNEMFANFQKNRLFPFALPSIVNNKKVGNQPKRIRRTIGLNKKKPILIDLGDKNHYMVDEKNILMEIEYLDEAKQYFDVRILGINIINDNNDKKILTNPILLKLRKYIKLLQKSLIDINNYKNTLNIINNMHDYIKTIFVNDNQKNNNETNYLNKIIKCNYGLLKKLLTKYNDNNQIIYDKLLFINKKNNIKKCTRGKLLYLAGRLLSKCYKHHKCIECELTDKQVKHASIVNYLKTLHVTCYKKYIRERKYIAYVKNVDNLHYKYFHKYKNINIYKFYKNINKIKKPFLCSYPYDIFIKLFLKLRHDEINRQMKINK